MLELKHDHCPELATVAIDAPVTGDKLRTARSRTTASAPPATWVSPHLLAARSGWAQSL